MTETVNWAAMMDESADAFELVPEGQYTVEVEAAEATTSSTGKLMYKLKMSIVEGKYTGETLFNNIVLTPDNKKAMAMFFINMDALGISSQFLRQSPTPSPEQVAQKMIGARAKAEVTHQEYQGVKRENVKSIAKLAGNKAPLGGAPVPPAAPAF